MNLCFYFQHSYFVNFSGKVKPFFKSQPVPKKQTGPLKAVVAKNFNKEILKSKKDVLIEFYAPWCGHCKILEPTLKKLAKHVAKTNPDVIVAKMDATANDVPPPFTVNGFPTLYFLRATDKDDPILYNGDRNFNKLKVSSYFLKLVNLD